MTSEEIKQRFKKLWLTERKKYNPDRINNYEMLAFYFFQEGHKIGAEKKVKK